MSISSEFIINTLCNIRKAGKNKKELSALIVADFPAREKVVRIKRKILEYHATDTKDIDMDDELKAMVEHYDTMVKNLPQDDNTLKHTADLMNMMLEPSTEHSKLLKNIGSIIKNTELQDVEKVDKISDLLI